MRVVAGRVLTGLEVASVRSQVVVDPLEFDHFLFGFEDLTSLLLLEEEHVHLADRVHLLLGDFGQRRTRLLIREYFIEDLLVDVGTLSDVLKQVGSFLLRHVLLVLVRQELRPQLLNLREDLRLLILGEADTLVVRLFDNVAFHVDDGLALERCGFLSFFLLLRRFSRQSLHFYLLALL